MYRSQSELLVKVKLVFEYEINHKPLQHGFDPLWEQVVGEDDVLEHVFVHHKLANATSFEQGLLLESVLLDQKSLAILEDQLQNPRFEELADQHEVPLWVGLAQDLQGEGHKHVRH